MLRDFDFSSATGRIDQIGFMASRENDLSFTSESPVVVRRHVFRYPGANVPVIGIVKLNLVELQRYIDSEVRALGPLPELEVTVYEPSTNNVCSGIVRIAEVFPARSLAPMMHWNTYLKEMDYAQLSLRHLNT